jgi:hypothetical protein
MDDAPLASGWQVSDETWAELGASPLGPPNTSSPAEAGAPAPDPAGPESRRPVAGCFLSLVALGVCACLVAVGWNAARQDWPLAGCALAVAACGAAAAGGACRLMRVKGDRGLPRPLVAAGPQRPRTSTVPRAASPGSAPQQIVYAPPGPESIPPPGAAVAALEEELLALCRGNWKLLNRLLDHARRRHPHLSRKELLGLAIDHYKADNR